MNKYIYLLAVVFGLSGCNDFLELSPTNKVIETDYYKTQEDLTEALVAAYDPLKWNAYNAYSSYELVSNIMSDDAETGECVPPGNIQVGGWHGCTKHG